MSNNGQCLSASDAFEQSFENASNHAASAGMRLTHPSEYQYQLRHNRRGFIVDAYYREDGTRKLCHNQDHKGPQLKLAKGWDLFDLVKAAIHAWNPPVEASGNQTSDSVAKSLADLLGATGAANEHQGKKYLRLIDAIGGKSILVDVYSVLEAFAVTCPARQHAIKKLLCAGIRGKGDVMDDLIGAKDAVSRAIELQNARDIAARHPY